MTGVQTCALPIFTTDDIDPYRPIALRIAHLFREYDLVQAYATDPMLPLLAGYRPYVAFEHGTLRTEVEGVRLMFDYCKRALA